MDGRTKERGGGEGKETESEREERREDARTLCRRDGEGKTGGHNLRENVYIPGHPITRKASSRASASRSFTLTSYCPKRNARARR